MRKLVLALVIFLVCLLSPMPAEMGEKVVILCYHDIGQVSDNNIWTISREMLDSHFRYLKLNGYTPISLQQYIDACEGKASLPPKPVLLTFDDGYASFASEVFPLLKQYQFPAVLSVVTGWQIGYGYKPADVGPLVSWQQMREMEQSGLVAIASHSHSLHRFLPANSAVTRPASEPIRYPDGTYEFQEAYRERLSADMEMNKLVLEKGLGHDVIAYTWPYGAYTQVAVDIGKSFGFKVFFTLREGFNYPGAAALSEAKRVAITNSTNDKELAWLLATGDVANTPLRVAQIDLDVLFDADRRQFENNIDAAIDYLRRCRVNTVFLEAHADDEGSGNIESVYFFTRHAPVKKDIFAYVVERLKAADFKVFAWMSTLAGQWLIKEHPEDAVEATSPDKLGWYKRATPFSPRVRESLRKLVGDLASYSSIDGVVFNDDLYFNDFEDFSPSAKAAFKARFGYELTAAALKDPAVMQEWTAMKTKALNDLSLELIAEIRKYRPSAASARNIYPAVIITPNATEWLAQDLRDYLRLYDYTVIMAYPRMEKVKNDKAWLKELAEKSLADPLARDKVIFKLQSFDWATDKWIKKRELVSHVKALRSAGALHIGYYPASILEDRAELLPF